MGQLLPKFSDASFIDVGLSGASKAWDSPDLSIKNAALYQSFDWFSFLLM